MRLTGFLFLVLVMVSCQDSSTPAYHPDEVFGDLFKEVQTTKILGDYKTFVDAVPKMPPAEILAAYELAKAKGKFDLKGFVEAYFELPEPLPVVKIDTTKDLITHLKSHWKVLVRQPAKTDANSTLIELPHPYVVPGGRFREMFYWDSYFSILGLLESDEDELAMGMIRNFAFLIDQYGYIPNGNRSYFLSRSQPPFFAPTLLAYADKHGMESIREFLPQLEKEYNFWMDNQSEIPAQQHVGQHLIVFENGDYLNRYYGAKDYARAEGYGKEMRWAEQIPDAQKPQFFRNLRTVCESGWDFSSRWYADGKNKSSIHAMDLIPIDLNSLLYMSERLIHRLYKAEGNESQSEYYKNRATTRFENIHKYLFDSSRNIFLDYDFVGDSLTNRPSLAMLYPLFAQCAKVEAAGGVGLYMAQYLLKPGGLVTTTQNTGEQWDFPNGWAPHQYIAAKGMLNYNQETLAKVIMRRWLTLNEKVYQEEGKMMEKYNVVDTTLKAGGGEYPNQDGFGWTNGVALVFHRWLNQASN